MDYTIKAIPTTYKGIEFRSRLEAKWAAFFDLCGWRWEYEPCEFDGWIPDFQLLLPHGKPFVEVKPVSDVRDWKAVWKSEIKIVPGNGVILLGTGPLNDSQFDAWWQGFWSLGPFVTNDTHPESQFGNVWWTWALFGRCSRCRKTTIVRQQSDGFEPCFNCGLTHCSNNGGVEPNSPSVQWSKACNTTKWRPRQ